mmetsp:Transcript_39914/g.107074  ORF Transcript_39914/g.107074 Transcript_39914/m.107074 type:complete len:331 (+) Transcript_39914:186-1178(+)
MDVSVEGDIGRHRLGRPGRAAGEGAGATAGLGLCGLHCLLATGGHECRYWRIRADSLAERRERGGLLDRGEDHRSLLFHGQALACPQGRPSPDHPEGDPGQAGGPTVREGLEGHKREPERGRVHLRAPRRDRLWRDRRGGLRGRLHPPARWGQVHRRAHRDAGESAQQQEAGGGVCLDARAGRQRAPCARGAAAARRRPGGAAAGPTAGRVGGGGGGLPQPRQAGAAAALGGESGAVGAAEEQRRPPSRGAGGDLRGRRVPTGRHRRLRGPRQGRPARPRGLQRGGPGSLSSGSASTDHLHAAPTTSRRSGTSSFSVRRLVHELAHAIGL